MPRFLALSCALLSLAPLCLRAETLSAEAIGATLTGARLLYDDGTRQAFAPDGRTLFFARDGSESIGHWEVRGDQYCSVWPPSDHWACYLVTRDGKVIGFVAADGSRSIGQVQP